MISPIKLGAIAGVFSFIIGIVGFIFLTIIFSNNINNNLAFFRICAVIFSIAIFICIILFYISFIILARKNSARLLEVSSYIILLSIMLIILDLLLALFDSSIGIIFVGIPVGFIAMLLLGIGLLKLRREFPIAKFLGIFTILMGILLPFAAAYSFFLAIFGLHEGTSFLARLPSIIYSVGILIIYIIKIIFLFQASNKYDS